VGYFCILALYSIMQNFTRGSAWVFRRIATNVTDTQHVETKRQRHVMNYCSRLSIRQGHSRRPTEIKVCTRPVSRIVLKVKFHQNQLNGFGDVGVVQAATTIEILVHLDATNAKFEAWGQTSCRWRKMLLKWSLRPRVGAF